MDCHALIVAAQVKNNEYNYFPRYSAQPIIQAGRLTAPLNSNVEPH